MVCALSFPPWWEIHKVLTGSKTKKNIVFLQYMFLSVRRFVSRKKYEECLSFELSDIN